MVHNTHWSFRWVYCFVWGVLFG